MNATSPLVQSRGSRVTADSAPMTRSWWMSGAMRSPANSNDAVVALVAVARRSSRTSAQASTWPVRRTSPTQPSSRRKTGSRPGELVGQAGPGGDLEPVVAQDPDRRRVGAQGTLRLVDDHPEQLGPVVRGGQPPGDAEDGVEALGELGLEGAARWSGGADRGRVGRLEHDRRRDRIGSAGGRRHGGCDRRSLPVRDARRRPAPGRRIERPRGRARTSRWLHCDLPRGPTDGPGHARTIVRGAGPTVGSVDRPNVAGLHSGGVAAPRGHDRQIPHPRSARPVDDGPSPIGGATAPSSPGTRSVPPPDG